MKMDRGSFLASVDDMLEIVELARPDAAPGFPGLDDAIRRKIEVDDGYSMIRLLSITAAQYMAFGGDIEAQLRAVRLVAMDKSDSLQP